MDLITFRDKLFLLQENKELTSDEIKFLNEFDSLDDIFKAIISIVNDTQDFILNKANLEIIQKNKKNAESIWFKILNTPIN